VGLTSCGPCLTLLASVLRSCHVHVHPRRTDIPNAIKQLPYASPDKTSELSDIPNIVEIPAPFKLKWNSNE